MTRAAVLTPPGRGAIAVVAVEGPKATEAVAACFLPAGARALADTPPDGLRYGRWRRPDGEELVVVRRGPASVEIHCHGGAAASAAILRSLGEQGVEAVDADAVGGVGPAGESPGRFAGEAWVALPNAATERVAGVLLDQASGALDDAIVEIVAAIDRGATDKAAGRLDALLAWRRLGERLLVPTRVVLAGPPNAGKSSLVNAVVGYGRAIVHHVPGTTRDVVTATTAVRGWPIELADTAGLRATDDPIEAAGVALARETLRRADVVVLVNEAGEAPPPRVDLPSGAATIRVASKSDLHGAAAPSTDALPTSVVSGRGVVDLVERIADAIAPIDPPAGEAIPFHARHFAALDGARAAVEDGDLVAARDAIATLREAD